MSQIEKQLELKEVSTRRKIQALRQQLQASGTAIHPAPPPSLHPNTTADQSHNTDRLASAHSNPSVVLTNNLHNGYMLPHTHEAVRPCISQQVSGTVLRAKAIGSTAPATAPAAVKHERQGIRSSMIPKSESNPTAGSVIGDWHMPQAQRSHDKQTTKTAQADAHVHTSCTQTVSSSPVTRIVGYIQTPRANAGPYYNQSTFGSLLEAHSQSLSCGDSKPGTTRANEKDSTKALHRYNEYMYTDAKKTASPKVEVSAKSSIPVENTPTAHPHSVPSSGTDIQHATGTNKVSDRLGRSQDESSTSTAEHSNPSVHVNQPECGASASLRRSQTTETLQSSSTSEPLNHSQQDTRPRLTLPEEIKETEYMTALQKQKARVSRIRRCIAAATVIQRAWREYKCMC